MHVAYLRSENVFGVGRISRILSDADCDKITAALLKSRTGEFDLESILFLKLRGLGKVLFVYHYLRL